MNDSIQLTVPAACTLNHLSIRISPNLGGYGGNDTLDFYVNVNNVPSAITCSLTLSSSAIETCSDSTHTVALSTGDRFAFYFVDTNSGDASNTPYAFVTSSVICN